MLCRINVRILTKSENTKCVAHGKGMKAYRNFLKQAYIFFYTDQRIDTIKSGVFKALVLPAIKDSFYFSKEQ